MVVLDLLAQYILFLLVVVVVVTIMLIMQIIDIMALFTQRLKKRVRYPFTLVKPMQ